MSGTTNILVQLCERQLIPAGSFAPWLKPEQLQYGVIMGSFSYGVASDTSDMDIYGWAMPDKTDLFPHLKGDIHGFDNIPEWKPWQFHHIKWEEAQGGAGREYDFQIYPIVQYFKLALLEMNPNMVDSLFVPERSILHMTPVAQTIRERRRSFLHKRCWHTFKGYSYQMVHKMKIKNPESGKRRELVDKYGYDTKYAYNVVRLLNEVEQILMEGDLDLERSREQLKSIRRGEWTITEIEEYFKFKEKDLETLYTNSKLPHGPDKFKIKELLMDTLEQHFGSLSGSLVRSDMVSRAFREISEIVDKVRAAGQGK